MLRKLKARMERESGVRFHLRTLRPTFAQTAKDARVSIEAVSRALRHGSTRTTEAYYARIRGEDAFREIERAFERPTVKLEPESREARNLHSPDVSNESARRRSHPR